MAMTVSQSIIGVDVAKAEVVVYRSETAETTIVPNNKPELKTWLKSLPAGSAIAIEATNIYHLDTVNLAHSMGHKVYVIDGYRLNHYRKGTGGRAKTDLSDAQLLARYLRNEQADLRAWNPPPKIYTKLQSLLRRRAALVKMRVALNQSWAGEPLLKASSKSISACLDRHEALIEKRILAAVTEAGVLHQVRRCQA
ncbi:MULTISPECIES: transposase, partial [Pseudomonas]|uniref:IS110 family transposase n=1 Tax=Pseudomonas TaxID=286 RepID=UPI001C303E49